MSRVLWVVPVSAIAGVARHVLDAAPRLEGYQVTVLCPAGPLAEQLVDRGVAVISAPFGPDYSLWSSLRAVRHAVAQVRPVLAHSHLSYADIALALAAPRGLPLVSTEHGIAVGDTDLVYHRHRLKSSAMALAHRWRIRRFAHLIAVSSATETAMRRRWSPIAPIRVIRNGVDPVAADPAVSAASGKPGLRVLSLARLAPEKRLDRLVEAFALVVDQHPEATLTLAGVGPLAENLAGQVARLGLSRQVSLPGFLAADDALAEADVLVMVSESENSPYAVLDAVSRGLGVVATPVGGIPEMVPAHCLVDAQRPTEVARRMLEQGLDVSQRPNRSAPGQAWPSVADMCAEMVQVYAEVRDVGSSGTSPRLAGGGRAGGVW